MTKDKKKNGTLLSLFRAESIICLGLHTVCFPRCKPCWYCLRFLRMCHEKERRRHQYLLTRPPKIIISFIKTVNFNFKIVLLSERFYFHPCIKNTESQGKNLIYGFCAKWALMSLYMIICKKRYMFNPVYFGYQYMNVDRKRNKN